LAGQTITVYSGQHEQTTSALHYFGPGDPGSLVDVSGAAVLASSKHSAAAQRFLAYLVDKPAQTIIATSESYEYPLGSGVATGQPLRPLDQLRPPALTVDDLGDGRAALAMLQKSGLL
jgi:iron(III) transport system substrate-binding protein